MCQEDDKRKRINFYNNKDRWSAVYDNSAIRKMIALYDYDPQQLSPNVDAEVELAFRTGDIIHVFGEMDDDGFFLAELQGQGRRGLVPSNFLTEATDYKKRGGTTVAPAPVISQTRGGGISGASGPPPPPREVKKGTNIVV